MVGEVKVAITIADASAVGGKEIRWEGDGEGARGWGWLGLGFLESGQQG